MVAADLKRKVNAATGCNWKEAHSLVEEAQEKLEIQNTGTNNEDLIVSKAADIYKEHTSSTLEDQRKPLSQRTIQTDLGQDENKKKMKTSARPGKSGEIAQGSLCRCCVVM